MPYVYLIVIVHEMVEEITRYSRHDILEAERAFLDQMEQRISNFNEYTTADINACFEDGYEGFGQGNSIQLHWSDT